MDEAHSFYGKIGELYIFLNFITCLNFGPCLQLACFLREKRDDLEKKMILNMIVSYITG